MIETLIFLILLGDSPPTWQTNARIQPLSVMDYHELILDVFTANFRCSAGIEPRALRSTPLSMERHRSGRNDNVQLNYWYCHLVVVAPQRVNGALPSAVFIVRFNAAF